MKITTSTLAFVTLLAFGTLAACSTPSTRSGDASDSTKSAELSSAIRRSLDQSGLKDVSASHNRSDGTVTLTGQVQAEDDRAKAETIAKSMMGSGQTVSNQISVMPMGAGHMGGHGPGGKGEAGPGHMGDHGRERKP